MNASASQRVATAAADLGKKCRSKRESTTSGGGERAREGGSESVGGRNVERGKGREGGGGVAGGEFRISRAEKGTERSKGESDKRRPHVELSVQGHDRSLPHTPRVVPQNVCSLSCASASEVQTTWQKSSPLRLSMAGAAGEGELQSSGQISWQKSMPKVLSLMNLTVINSRFEPPAASMCPRVVHPQTARHIATATLTYVCRCRLEGGYTSVRRKSSWDEGASEGWTRRAEEEEGEEGL